MINVMYFQMENHFVANDEYSLKYFINGELDIQTLEHYEIIEDDKILITFGGETDEQDSRISKTIR